MLHRLTILAGRLRTCLLPLLALAALLLAVGPAHADVPQTLAVSGRLATGTGGPAPDGDYLLVVGLYAAPIGGKALHQEVHVGVPVQSGLFHLALGETQAFAPTLFDPGQAAWVGVSVGGEKELPRAALRPVSHALRLLCTGCIGASHLDPAVLAPYAKQTDLAKVATSGQFGDLQGLPTLVKVPSQCPAGQVALGILGDGTIACGHPAFAPKLGVGKPVAAGCALDIGTDDGGLCVDGVGVGTLRYANSAVAMDKLAVPGALVFRTDESALYLRVGSIWRRLSFQVVCGDSFVEGAEQCDDGPANADAPDKCRKNCSKPACGDAIQDGAEQCDDGNGSPNDACVACKTAVCGDGHVQLGVEACDDGAANANAPDKCRTSCKKPACADGILDSGEECDDGNLKAADGCTPQCLEEILVDVTFSACGAVGRFGPSQSQCNGAYSGGQLQGKVTVAGGIQTWVVPADGTYTIEASGSQGGDEKVNQGGKGARMRGDFALKKGQVVQILVGQRTSQLPSTGTRRSAGAGGGTFVVVDGTPVLVAGGGGGASAIVTNDVHASAGLNGQNGGDNVGKGGVDGLAGSVGNSSAGGGGAGWKADGPNNSSTGGPGVRFLNGGAGGAAHVSSSGNYGSDGGFGGGGGGWAGGAGGGGWSGGGSGSWVSDTNSLCGGGGGSLNTGTNQNNQAGVHTGQGQVHIVAK